MAYLDATDLLDIQSSEATNEKRFSELGIVDAVKESTPVTQSFLKPSAVEQLRTSSSIRDVQIPVLKDKQVVVNTTPGFNFIPSNLPESAQYAFTAYDVFTGFRHYPAQFASNAMDGEWAKKEVMKGVLYEAANTIESILTTTLEARKTQVLTATEQVSATTGDYAFSGATDILSIKKAAQEETMFYSLEQLMAANELGGMYRTVVNRAGLARQKAEAMKYGAGNDKNLQALGFFGADRMHETGNISAGSDKFNGFLLRDGSIGMIENFPFDFQNGTTIGERKWSISDIELPWTRMRANVYVNNEATDATALVKAGSPVDSNMIMTHFSEMAMWFRFYIVYPYNSDLATRANDIVKIKGLTT